MASIAVEADGVGPWRGAINASQKRRHLQVRKDGQGSATFHTEGKAQVRQEDESVGNKRRG